MKRRISTAIVATIATLMFSIANAQTARTEHTFGLDDPDSRPPATLDAAAMLVGSWRGEAFGGTFETVWNPPSKGSMVGFFKLMGDEAVGFYEILLLVEEEGTLNLKVKHFNPDFTAWEEKEDYVNFRFIMADDNAVHFSGLSFYRISDVEMHAYIRMKRGDDIREEKLVYHRTD